MIKRANLEDYVTAQDMGYSLKYSTRKIWKTY